MNKPDRADVRQVHLRVNGITFESVRVRRDLRSGDFDIVIDHPHIGRFALTAAVPDLELLEEDADWRQVTLDELKKILAEAAEEPQASEAAERESFNRLVAEGEHIMRAEIALFNAGVPFLQLPFQQDKFASSLFMVLSVEGQSLLAASGVPTEVRFRDGPVRLLQRTSRSTDSRKVQAAESKELANQKRSIAE